MNILRKFPIATLALMLMVSCSSGAGDDGFTELFNGKDFTGFKQLNGKAKFEVVDGVMVGTTTMYEPNSFMATEQTYGDFILEFEVECDPALNSGVQFRSQSTPDYRNGRVHGYQCEIDPSPRAWSGGVYDEAGRGWLMNLSQNPTGQTAYKKEGWNHYRVEALGNNIRIWVNGINTSNLYDDAVAEGFIAFQVHSIYDKKEKENIKVKWRNIKILTEDVAGNLKEGPLTPSISLIPNTLGDIEVAQGWKLLFDGKTTKGWRNAFKDTFPTAGWSIKNGVLSIEASGGGESTNAGDIVTENEYSAFELSVDFKLSSGANSGIKYFVTEEEKVNPKAKASAFGLEFQLLDDAKHKDAKLFTTFPGSRTLGSLYDMKSADAKKPFKGVGKWNTAVVKVFPNNHVEHWLNGKKILEYERGSKEYKELVKGSKYAKPTYNTGVKPFGEGDKGHILLQDHGNYVQFKNIKIKELK